MNNNLLVSNPSNISLPFFPKGLPGFFAISSLEGCGDKHNETGGHRNFRGFGDNDNLRCRHSDDIKMGRSGTVITSLSLLFFWWASTIQ